jgi:hypothetical protein
MVITMLIFSHSQYIWQEESAEKVEVIKEEAQFTKTLRVLSQA